MKLIRAAAAGRIFGVSGGTIRNWDKQGLLKPDFVTPAGHRFYSEERLRERLKAGRLTEVEREEPSDDGTYLAA